MADTAIPNAQGNVPIVFTTLIDDVGTVTFVSNTGAPLVWNGTGTSWAPVNNTQ
jgi:hypothetical protein